MSNDTSHMNRRKLLKATGTSLTATSILSGSALAKQSNKNKKNALVNSSSTRIVSINSDGEKIYLITDRDNERVYMTDSLPMSIAKNPTAGQITTSSTEVSTMDVSTMDVLIERWETTSEIIGTCPKYTEVDNHYSHVLAVELGKYGSVGTAVLSAAVCGLVGYLSGVVCAASIELALSELQGNSSGTFSIGAKDCDCYKDGRAAIRLGSSSKYTLDSNDLDYTRMLGDMHLESV